MYDQELDINAPYDNVEFPVRKPGTGTWPGPGAATTAGSGGIKLYGHQTTGRTGGGPKLAPLVEVDGAENGESNRLQNMNFGTTSSSLSSSSSSSTQQHQQLSNQTSQTRAMTSQTKGGISGGPAVSTTKSSLLSSSATAHTTTTASSLLSTTNTTTTTAGISTTSTTTPAKTTTTSEKGGKPVIVVTNDSNTYIATQVVGDSTKKKTLKQVETEEEDFKRQDLNPAARLALERVYTVHPDFYQLNSKVLDEGSLLKQDVLEIYRRTGETLTYEQLLQGILVDGERFLLSSCWLYFTHVQFLDLEGTKALREPYGRGRIGLTSKRALFLSNETYTDANLEQFQRDEPDKNKKNGKPPSPDKLGYKLEVSKRSTMIFKNIPLSNFHSAEMEVVTGTAAQTKISKRPPCCGCFGMLTGKWVSTPPMTRSIISRVLRLGVSMPPWQTRMFIDIHLDPSMSLTVARDFISQLHAFAPHMH